MEHRELSAAEAVIMKAIWEAKQDISVIELMRVLKENYGKDYKRTTMATFLLRLSEKDFISVYKDERLSYVHVEIPEEEYRAMIAKKDVDFWFKGRPCDLFATLYNSGSISKEDVAQIRGILDDMDH